jgi:hypothetical protein
VDQVPKSTPVKLGAEPQLGLCIACGLFTHSCASGPWLGLELDLDLFHGLPGTFIAKLPALWRELTPLSLPPPNRPERMRDRM